MQRIAIAAGAAFLFLALSVACGGPKSAKGFRLPDGDIARGEVAFLELSCHACHTVAGIQLPAVEGAGGATSAPIYEIGGKVRQVRTYGELVTSILNPSHEISPGVPFELATDEDGRTRMADFNDRMTVAQLIDIVAFLQSRYEVSIPEWDVYYP